MCAGLLLVLAGCSFPIPPVPPEAAAPLPPGGPGTLCGTPNFAWTIANALARSAQPPAAAWTCLHAEGLTTIIRQNVEEDDGSEQRGVEAAGMQYIGDYRIPDQTAYSPAQLETLMQDVVTRLEHGERILVHDAGGRGRMGFWEATFLLWDGWSAREAIERYLAFGWKIDCDKGGNGQMQGINELAAAFGQPPYYPAQDIYGTVWNNCPRPGYMAGWDYHTIRWPPGGGGRWSKIGAVPTAPATYPNPR